MLTWPSSCTITETTPPTPPRSATAARTPGAELPLKATKMRANTPTGTNAPREKTIGTGHWTSTKLLSRDTWTGASPNTPTASTPGHVFLTSPSQREKRGQACANARRALPVLGHGACGGHELRGRDLGVGVLGNPRELVPVEPAIEPDAQPTAMPDVRRHEEPLRIGLGEQLLHTFGRR